MDRIRLPATVPARLQAFGIAPAAVLRRARLSPTLFQQQRVLVTTAQWFALWDAVASMISDPTWGLRIAQAAHDEPYDPLTILALSAPSYHDALLKVARYKRLFAAEELRVEQHGSRWSIEVVWPMTQQAAPLLLVDWTMAHLLNLGQRGTGQAVAVEQVCFRRQSAHRAVYEAWFRCAVEFSAERDMLVVSDDVMMQPFITASPDLLAMLEPQLEAALGEHAETVLSEQVKRLLRRRMAGHEPTTREIADELNMSPRTLQRRLADEGLQFGRLLDTIRREAAKEYLRGSTLTLNEIAFLLGYQEASSFHRAFQQWEGQSPGRWREALRQTAA